MRETFMWVKEQIFLTFRPDIVVIILMTKNVVIESEKKLRIFMIYKQVQHTTIFLWLLAYLHMSNQLNYSYSNKSTSTICNMGDH